MTSRVSREFRKGSQSKITTTSKPTTTTASLLSPVVIVHPYAPLPSSRVHFPAKFCQINSRIGLFGDPVSLQSRTSLGCLQGELGCFGRIFALHRAIWRSGRVGEHFRAHQGHQHHSKLLFTPLSPFPDRVGASNLGFKVGVWHISGYFLWNLFGIVSFGVWLHQLESDQIRGVNLGSLWSLSDPCDFCWQPVVEPPQQKESLP